MTVSLLAFLLIACAEPADWVLRGGRVHTMDDRRSEATALAIRGERLIAVGSDEEISTLVGPRTRIVDLDGAAVLPGFHDSHIHLLAGAMEMEDLSLAEAKSPEAITALLAEHAARHGDLPVLRGSGWDLSLFPGGRPHRRLLDAVVADRPVILDAADGHSCWVNGRALALAGIDAGTPDPEGGRIERDPETGAPTGCLRESAMALVAGLLPERSTAERERALTRGLELAAACGITSINEAAADESLLETYRRFDRDRRLSLHVRASIRVDTAADPVAERDRLLAARRRFDGADLQVDSAKIFLDGVIETRTAAMLEDYLDRPGFRGELRVEGPRLEALARVLQAAGFQLHFHAIGDRAVRAALDAVEAAGPAPAARRARHQIAHAQVIAAEDAPRFARLGVFVDFQPLWAQADAYIRDLTLPVLGEKARNRIYPIRSLQEAGAPIVFGSDWNVSSMNPLEGIEVGMRRVDVGKTREAPFLPRERASLDLMLAGYTREGARLAQAEDERGLLTPGRLADLVVLAGSPAAVESSQIGAIEVRATFFRGRLVHASPGLALGRWSPERASSVVAD